MTKILASGTVAEPGWTILGQSWNVQRVQAYSANRASYKTTRGNLPYPHQVYRDVPEATSVLSMA